MNRTFSICIAIIISTTDSAKGIDVLIPVAADTTLNEASPGNNMGGNSQILAGTDNGGRDRRGILRFDVVSALPAGAVIDSASLTLSANFANIHAATYSLHRVLVPWGEGTGAGSSGQAAISGDATWNSAQHGITAWAAPGGAAGSDYVALGSSTVAVENPGTYDFMNLAADVQSMFDSPGTNFGWMLISGSEGTPGTGRQFESRETVADTPPVLSVSYSIVPEPSGLALVATGAAAIIASRWRRTKNRRAV